MKLAVVMGTRPEIIKLYPIISKLKRQQCTVIFSGQHYDYELSKQFMENFKMRTPDHWAKLDTVSGSKKTKPNVATRTGEMISKISPVLEEINPDTTVVQGDTNTVLAGSIASLKLNIPVSHIEAGIRSFDWRMQEEHNRIVADHLGELLFAPTYIAKENLSSESVHGKIHVTGNTVIDAIERFAGISSKKSNLESMVSTSIKKIYGKGQGKAKNDVKDLLCDFALMTIHRAENVDSKETLSSIVNGVLDSQKRIVFPVHPRTLKRLEQFGLLGKVLKSKNVFLAKSVGYFDFIELMKKCAFIITDSGGIQEEATSPKIKKRVLVLREKTDRPESVSAGFSEIVGLKPSKIVSAIKSADKNRTVPSMPEYARKSRRSGGLGTKNQLSSNRQEKTAPAIARQDYYPYGNGNASEKIISILKKSF